MADLHPSSVYMPDFGAIAERGHNAFLRGREDYQAGVTKQAGSKMAGGDYKGARNAFMSAGMVDQGLKLQSQIDAMDDRQREAAKRVSSVIGNGALAADTPEKWGALVNTLKARGMDVGKYADFSTREAAIAEAGQTASYLERADAQAKTKADAMKPMEVGGALVRQQPDGTFKEVYAPRPKVAGPKKYEFTKYGVGDPETGDIRPYPEGTRTEDPKDRRDAAKFEQDLRKEHAALAKDARAIQDGVARVEEGAKIGKGAGDIALIYGFMKINDPGSVVRETEFDIAQNIGSLPDRWQGWVSSMLQGQSLPPNVRNEIVAMSRQLARAKMEEQATIDAEYRRIATDAGADPARVVLPYGRRTGQQAAPARALPRGGFKATMRPAEPIQFTEKDEIGLDRPIIGAGQARQDQSPAARPSAQPSAGGDLKSKSTEELLEMLRTMQ